MINLYCIKDVKGDFQSQILSVPNDDSARRSVSFIRETSELFKRYPQDFVLYRIGMFDFESGYITPESTPVYICDLGYGGANEDMA